MNVSPRKLIINADDLGMHPAIDHAIAMLAGAGVVSSASLLVLGQPDRDMIAHLDARGINLGLHLDFTSSLFHSRLSGKSRSVYAVMADAWGGRLQPQQAQAIVRDQLEQFQDIAGRMPDFVDGHEHIHQFPVIRQALIDVLSNLDPARRVFIRDTRSSCWRGMKAAIIGMLGAPALAAMTAQTGYRCNTDFLGVYDLSGKADLPGLWRDWLASLPAQGALAMCHPALHSGAGEPSLAPFRLREYRFLSSAQFSDLLAEHGVQVVNWQTALGDDDDRLPDRPHG